ncbi:FAD-binding domain-containing protein [Rhizodiscina lignyota]|uniref:FAD-binding domain-containing protein n=1 Tax=Rhizodiscina lignyota TaxID=1504668 RepID=A0A9P4IPH0_9PEZI|nr:FAD-binding domain-containing protein [Rhizodiscina lignyota]
MLSSHSVPFLIASFVLATSATSVVDIASYCKLLASKVGHVSYPGSSTYNDSISSYYSGQERQLHPGCVFSPTCAEDVSRFIKLINPGHGYGSYRGPQFALRSGGHMIWTGAANIQGGITVDMGSMNSLQLSEDRKIVSLGSGGIWSEIYPVLDKYNLTVMGGRVPGIGVGGFSTGGGISYLSRRQGWACENIYNYQLVDATGQILEVNERSYPDLWLALKGGSNNYGIVTRIEAPTWEIEGMWGGGLAFNYTPEILAANAKAFSSFMDPKNFDDSADMGMALVFQNPGQVYAVGGDLYYIKPVVNPPIYRPFTAIPSIANTLRLTNVTSLVTEASGSLPPGASRAIDLVFSFRNGDADFYSDLFKIWEDGTEALAHIENLQLVLLIQPQPVSTGKSSLGLPAGETDFVVTVLTAAYANAADDDTVQKGMEDIVVKQEDLCRQKGLYIPYQYLNYADRSQDPIASYGKAEKARLQAVSKKYDLNGFFQSALPGGFKVFP